MIFSYFSYSCRWKQRVNTIIYKLGEIEITLVFLGYFYQPGSSMNKQISASYTKRRDMLRDNNAYKADGAVFVGQIFHDLVTNESG